MEKGLQQGIEQGIRQGIEQGVRALQEVLNDLLSSRFGALDPAVARRISEIESVDELKRMTRLAMQATCSGEVFDTAGDPR